MKVKYLVNKKTKEFGEILVLSENYYDLYTSDKPTTSINLSVNFEEYKKYVKDNYDDQIDLTDYEIKEFDLIEFGEVGADIRNKLSPPKNLVNLLEIYFDEESVVDKKQLLKYIKNDMKKSKESIDYIANLL